jgi:hypothetical protein
LAQAGQWLARKFVVIWKFVARPNGSGSPAFAKPPLRWVQAGDSAVVNGKSTKMLEASDLTQNRNYFF